MAFIFCFLSQLFFRGRGNGREGELQQRSVPLSTTHCDALVTFTNNSRPMHKESKTVLDARFHAVDFGF